MYQDIKFCVKYGEYLIYNCATQKKGSLKGEILVHMFINIFINQIIKYLNIEEAHFSAMNRERIPGLLFPDDLAIASSTSYGLQKKIAVVNQYFKNWNLNFNSRKSHIMILKKGRKLKATEGWRANEQNLEVEDNFNYLGVT
jgi:hypothetical protein